MCGFFLAGSESRSVFEETRRLEGSTPGQDKCYIFALVGNRFKFLVFVVRETCIRLKSISVFARAMECYATHWQLWRESKSL